MSKIEIPNYTVKLKNKNFEIREYPRLLQAQVEITGERYSAINAAFRILADFIFGNNTTKQPIAMTAPFTQHGNEKIAMTAPVTQHSQEGNWQVEFTMPTKYTLNNLPVPNDPRVKIIEIAPKTFIVIRFRGFNSDSNLQNHLQHLIEYIHAKQLQTIGEPIYAFYNPPWTLPFLRRNEIMIELKS